MAWYAELKRRQWYCINGGSATQWYRRKLYDDWYNSLTEEQKLRLEENKKKRAEQRDKELKQTMSQLLSMTAMMAGTYGGLYDKSRYLKEK